VPRRSGIPSGEGSGEKLLVSLTFDVVQSSRQDVVHGAAEPSSFRLTGLGKTDAKVFVRGRIAGAARRAAFTRPTRACAAATLADRERAPPPPRSTDPRAQTGGSVAAARPRNSRLGGELPAGGEGCDVCRPPLRPHTVFTLPSFGRRRIEKIAQIASSMPCPPMPWRGMSPKATKSRPKKKRNSNWIHGLVHTGAEFVGNHPLEVLPHQGQARFRLDPHCGPSTAIGRAHRHGLRKEWRPNGRSQGRREAEGKALEGRAPPAWAAEGPRSSGPDVSFAKDDVRKSGRSGPFGAGSGKDRTGAVNSWGRVARGPGRGPRFSISERIEN